MTTWEIREGDVLDRLREMPDESAHMVCTSPPYWGLRDYGTAAWAGGDPECGHVVSRANDRLMVGSDGNLGRNNTSWTTRDATPTSGGCGRCGARRVDQQLGLETTPAEYVARMVAVFREVRRVMRSDATLWLNMGDSYQDKQLLMMPARLALALQADGWWLRSEIIWAKLNPMPESVQDRPTKAHEQIFLLTKRGTYFYDSDAIREPAQNRPFDPAMKTIRPNDTEWHDNRYAPGASGFGNNPAGRNARSVWTIATQPYAEAHFATFPEELPRRCILAGTSERGVCPACGAPWRRVVERGLTAHDGETASAYASGSTANRLALLRQAARERGHEYAPTSTTTGWDPECSHALDPVPAVVLDPFAGSGTTLMVAVRHGRAALGIELNPEYAAMARRRILADHGAVEPTNGRTPAEVRGVQGRLAF